MSTPDQDWRTPEVRRAEAELDASMEAMEEVLRSAQELQDSLRPAEITATEEDIRAIEREAAKPDAPAELRALRAKVEAGDLSWRDVLEGRAYDDPEVRAALEPNLGRMGTTYQLFQEGHTLDEVVEAHRQSQRRNNDDDDDGGENIVLRHDSW
ncbi:MULTISPECIES: hypothetical protein [unclassified Crossiella]|uniref:hypothetical protein n=1 Tax=unclassified Crossiella TaxID=2620835 RepID=UPI001FFE3C98|nr:MULTISPECIES: hypothetical protein [unclassified Crossiella]MCK2236755.1 hypothetical protein [Crossiella sp. S99.2]MCK2250423.1 hypothetical protein [Crossiella sp. S99.1]